jgi:hypothetical protein
MTDRKAARWMCTLDERIIEHLQDDSWSTPHHISRVIKFNASRDRVDERCKVLTRAGLIAPIYEDANLYEITSEGQQYLRGELDAEHLPSPSPQTV